MSARISNMWWSVFVLTTITLIAYSNAAHDALVLDDKFFVGPQSILDLESAGDAFFRSVREDKTTMSRLYRPLLLIIFDLEDRVFGDWAVGYHLVNILEHLAASLSLFGLLLRIFKNRGESGKASVLAALLSASVFAVHPVHAEVVNSVFNSSSLYVSICAILGLWWLFKWLDEKPVRAWVGLGLFFSVGILFKESALVIPGIAVALVVLLSPGGFRERIQRIFPVFALLAPIAVYFLLRQNALATDAGEGGAILATVIPDANSVMAVLGYLGSGLKVLIWPYPMRLFYPEVSGTVLWSLIALQVGLLAGASYLFTRGRPGLAAGLSFYYIAMLPASRIISVDGIMPHLAERYLYFPSIGLAITLALALNNFNRRHGPRLPFLLGLTIILLMSALTWERNREWSDEYLLFRTEYERGYRDLGAVRLIVANLAESGNHAGVIEICEENPEMQAGLDRISNACAISYLQLNQIEKALSSLELSARHERAWLAAKLAMGDILIQQGRLQEGADRYAEVINGIDDPAQKEVLKGVLFLKLYPGIRARVLEAKGYFEKALELDPGSEEAKAWLEHTDSLLNPGEG